MEIKAKLKEYYDRAMSWVADQPAFQQIKAKWDELDPQSRLYAQIAGLATGAFFSFFILASFYWKVSTLENEYKDKIELVNLLQQSSDELRRLRDSAGSGKLTAGTGGSWAAHFEIVAASSGVDKSKMTVSNEKSGTSSELAKEALMDISLKKINIKQAIRFVYNLENGNRPVKVRNFIIDTKSDPTGYLDANFAVSAFTLGEKK
ncbi:MAG: hypothetical protein AABZ55_14110 [Bdellovibrionota bacterium]